MKVIPSKNICITVVYSYTDGAHFFTSKDDLAKGLCVAQADLEDAYNEVGEQLVDLLKCNHKMQVKVSPENSYDEFVEWLGTQIKTTNSKIKALPAAEVQWLAAA